MIQATLEKTALPQKTIEFIFESSVVPGLFYNLYNRTMTYGDHIRAVRPQSVQILLFLESHNGRASIEDMTDNCWDFANPPAYKTFDHALRVVDKLLNDLNCGFYLEWDSKSKTVKIKEMSNVEN